MIADGSSGSRHGRVEGNKLNLCPLLTGQKALNGVGNTEWQVGEPGEEQAHHAYDAGEATGRRGGLSAQGLAQVSLQTSGWPTALI